MIRREYDRNGNQTYYKRSVLDSDKVENLAGVFDEDFKVKVNAFIEGEVFCNAVRRCLLNDLIAGAMDEDDNNRQKKHY
ncbi:hypothetical protein JOC75_000485 [Metabacillus crassostreae]|uniref:hypothetical protein n=1 Tax=Metabacillus crassostreae TaxID=929098 RepID=UPI00195D4464|nr:hypothetical protein [Metabacillus crassostreae]MBM7602515.1 hypothetical protein [Metabacillus crassostreae]